MNYFQTFVFILLLSITSCTTKQKFSADFNNINDRIWVGRDFWSIPLEDWKIENGKLLCQGIVPDSRVNILTYNLSPAKGNFKVSARIMLVDKGDVEGSAGLLLGVHDKEDPDVRAACYFGEGLKAGISLNGFAFLKDKQVDLPTGFDFSEVILIVSGNNNQLKMSISDKNGNSPDALTCKIDGINGLIALANNIRMGGNQKPGNSKFAFDDIKLSGSKVIYNPENSFGPVLWTMYTLSKKTVKLMALLPPLGENDNREISLQLKKGELWETIESKQIEADSRTAVYKLEKWDDSIDVKYRIEYIEKGKDGTEWPDYYEGTIRKNPAGRPLKFGGFTCQYHYGFPYTPLVESVMKQNPDILYFSGDQIYEPNGGYPIKREPADVSIVNYLGKYYMFGWAFRSVMRDRPTICTPDDHDVYHGNLWGEGGIAKPGGIISDDTRGFTQSVKMVNVVNRTQCGQLPDPYDPAPIERGMSVWYTDLIYGRVSFAIVTDRVFKTGPETVSDWEGRKDHFKEPRKDLSFLEKPGLILLGERQIKFLNDWITQWDNADMKVLLSQTLFANVATHHGNLQNILYGDLDSGGWPKPGRDKVIRIMRKCAAFHICGDQHVPSLVQYGLQNYRDAGWSFCTPAIAVGYQRWFLPDELNYPVSDRPEHGYPNTGKYDDAFGNKNYVYAIGNPGKITMDKESRYNQALIRSSGYGMIIFDTDEREIEINAWRFKADVENPNPVRDQFPGWPFTISQFDNLGMGADNVLPEITLDKEDQVIQIWNESTGELSQILRIKGTSIKPRLHDAGIFTLKIGEGSDTKEIKGLKTKLNDNKEKITINISR